MTYMCAPCPELILYTPGNFGHGGHTFGNNTSVHMVGTPPLPQNLSILYTLSSVSTLKAPFRGLKMKTTYKSKTTQNVK